MHSDDLFCEQTLTVHIQMLWTFSTRSRESGALQFSACLVRIWPPHRCRIRDSRSSLEAIELVARGVIVVAVIAERLEMRGGSGGMHEMHAWEECGALNAYNMCCAQTLTVIHFPVFFGDLHFPMLWTFSTRSREYGALQFSAMLDGGWPPHRCLIKDSRSLLEAKVSRVIVVAVIEGRLACARGMHEIHA